MKVKKNKCTLKFVNCIIQSQSSFKLYLKKNSVSFSDQEANSYQDSSFFHFSWQLLQLGAVGRYPTLIVAFLGHIPGRLQNKQEAKIIIPGEMKYDFPQCGHMSQNCCIHTGLYFTVLFLQCLSHFFIITDNCNLNLFFSSNTNSVKKKFTG